MSPGDAYRWLYLDVAGEGFTAVAIFMYGAPFSSGYSARAPKGARPDEHSAVNFALYRNGVRKAWVLSEYPASEWSAGDDRVRIGHSSLAVGADGRVTVEIDERSAPWGRRVRARIELRPLGPGHPELELVPGQPHYWRPRAPHAEARVEVDDPEVAFSGAGYFDANRGAELLGGGVPGWRGARLHRGDHTEIVYEPPGSTVRVLADAQRVTVEREPARDVRVTRTRWGLEVPESFDTRSGPARPSPMLLESSPFYARVQASAPGGELLGEVADFRRFHRPSVRWMARFRTRVES